MSFKTDALNRFGFKSFQEFHGYPLDIVAPAVDKNEGSISLKFTCIQVCEMKDEVSLYFPVPIRLADGRISRCIVWIGEWYLKLEDELGAEKGVRPIYVPNPVNVTM